MMQLQNEWKEISSVSSINRGSHNAVTVGIVSAVYNYLLSFIVEFSHTDCNPTASSSVTVNEKPDDVYFRFGGGALANMFHIFDTNKLKAPSLML